MKTVFTFVKKLRLFRAVGIGLFAVFFYYLFSGVHYAFIPKPDQDMCEFNTISNNEYRKILKTMSYDIYALRDDYDKATEADRFSQAFSDVIEKNLRKALNGTNSFDEKIATTHAFMRKMGYAVYDSHHGKNLYGVLSDTMEYYYRLEYKMISARINIFDIYSYIARAPSTTHIMFETDDSYKAVELTSFHTHYMRAFMLDSTAANFEQNYICPQNLQFKN